jgi:hypothetical protein
MPYGTAAILAGLFGGVLLAYLVIAFLADAPQPATRTSGFPGAPLLPQPPPDGNREARESAPVAIGQRLAEENARIESLEAERERLHDSRFAKTIEQRIIWSELLELELQDIDEQIRSKGGHYERNDL